jgi:B9 domain-containing protein 1
MTPHGWPQLVLYCTAIDSDGHEFVRAYGCTHIPIAPGVSKKEVRMFTPIAQNRCLEFFGVFSDGNGMVIDDPALIAKGQGREVARVKAGGKVTVSINLTERNFERHGYICKTERK